MKKTKTYTVNQFSSYVYINMRKKEISSLHIFYYIYNLIRKREIIMKKNKKEKKWIQISYIFILIYYNDKHYI